MSEMSELDKSIARLTKISEVLERSLGNSDPGLVLAELARVNAELKQSQEDCQSAADDLIKTVIELAQMTSELQQARDDCRSTADDLVRTETELARVIAELELVKSKRIFWSTGLGILKPRWIGRNLLRQIGVFDSYEKALEHAISDKPQKTSQY